MTPENTTTNEIFDTISGWVFYTTDGEMLEARIATHRLSAEHEPYLLLITANDERVEVPFDPELPAPYLDATKRALEALKQLRAPPPSRISRSSTGGRRRILGGGS